MKRTVLTAAAALFAALSLCACGGGLPPETAAAAAPETDRQETAPAAEAETEAAPADLTAIRDAIVGELGLDDAMDMDPALLSGLYDIAEDEYAQYAAFVTMAGIFPHEIVMFEAADDAAAQDIAEKLGRRLDEIMDQAAGYDPANYALAQKCEVRRDGLFVALFLSPDAERMQAICDSMR